MKWLKGMTMPEFIAVLIGLIIVANVTMGLVISKKNRENGTTIYTAFDKLITAQEAYLVANAVYATDDITSICPTYTEHPEVCGNAEDGVAVQPTGGTLDVAVTDGVGTDVGYTATLTNCSEAVCVMAAERLNGRNNIVASYSAVTNTLVMDYNNS